MQEIDRFIASLFPANGPTIVDLKFFPGEEPVTESEFTEKAHAVFLQVDSGLLRGAENFAEDLTRVSVDRFLFSA